jgi:hypothetical protein
MPQMPDVRDLERERVFRPEQVKAARDAVQHSDFGRALLNVSGIPSLPGGLNLNASDAFSSRLFVSLTKYAEVEPGVLRKHSLLGSEGSEWIPKLACVAFKNIHGDPKSNDVAVEIERKGDIGLLTSDQRKTVVGFLNRMSQDEVDRFAIMTRFVDDPRIIPAEYASLYIQGKIPVEENPLSKQKQD